MANRKFLIAGLGSIGRRHLKNLETLGEVDIVFYRTNKSTLPKEDLDAYPVFTNLEDALETKPDAVIIANPTFLHMQVAIPAVEAECALLIEKPISHRLDELMAFEQAVEKHHPIVLTAYQFRFNTGLQKIKELLDKNTLGIPKNYRCSWGEYLPGWHPWEDYRISYAANTEMGGGVVLTLSHPLDYLRWLFGEVAYLTAVTGNQSNLDLVCEDTADINMRHESGVDGSLHLDYYQQPKEHFLTIVCTEGELRWDYSSSDVTVLPALNEPYVISGPANYERNDMYFQEMMHFIDCLDGKCKPICGYEDGKQALILAESILRSGRYNEQVFFNRVPTGKNNE